MLSSRVTIARRNMSASRVQQSNLVQLGTGQKVFIVQVILAYVLPFMAHLAVGDSIYSAYHVYDIGWRAMVSLPLICISTILLTLAFPGQPRLVFLRSSFGWIAAKVGAFFRPCRVFIALASIALGSYSLAGGRTGYRYSELGLSEGLSWTVTALIVCNLLIVFDLLCRMFGGASELPDRWTRIVNIGMSVGLVIGANGTASMFMGLGALFYSLMPGLFGRVMILDRRMLLAEELRQTVGVLAVMFGLSYAAWFCGETIKARSGAEDWSTAAYSVVDRIDMTSGKLVEYGLGLVERLSIYYYSYLFTCAVPFETLQGDQGSALYLPVNSFQFRANLLLGKPFDIGKPAVTSVMQLNYRLLSAEALRDREGSSPGVVASFNYVAPFPINIVLCVVYLFVVCKIIDGVFVNESGRRVSLIGLFILSIFVRDFFQSPVDFLLVFDEGIIFIGLIIFYWLAQRPKSEVVR